MNPSLLGIIIPAYRAKDSLQKFLPELLRKVSGIPVLVVDDGSADGTAALCESFGIECISFPENRGKGSALYEGIRAGFAKGWEWALSMDADGQHAAEDVSGFLNAAAHSENRVGILAGKREFRLGIMPFARILSNRISTGMVSFLLKTGVYDAQCGFRAYRTAMLEKNIFPESGRFEWESAVLMNAVSEGFLLKPVPVQTIYFEDGGTHISPVKDTIRFLRLLFRFWKCRKKGK